MLIWFEKLLDAVIGSDQVGDLIAWNGEEWLYKAAQAPYS